MKPFLRIALVLLLLPFFACSGSKETSEEKEDPSKKEVKRIKNKDPVELDTKELKKKSQGLGQKDSSQKERKGGKALFLLHERTPCYGQCPVYTLKVHPDRKAELRVKRSSELDKGHYKGTVPEQKIEAIKEKARSISFFELDKVYDDENVTDLPSRTTRLQFGGKKHEVRNRYGGPDGLEELEKLIQKLVEENEWKRAASKE